MDYSSIKTGLESFVERYDSQTYIGSYRETGRSSLLNEGLSTRANSLWKMAEYVVAKYDGRDTPLFKYINGWKQLAAGAANQYLLIEENRNNWGMYDSQGTRLGGEDFIHDYFSQQKKKQRKDTQDILVPTGTVQQIDCNKRIAPYLSAIRTKPFLLLAGISGTGKSRIVRELAFKSCPEYLQDKDGTTPGNYCMIEVKPNWHDSTELLGYYSNMNKCYQFKKFVKFLVKAKMFPKVPFFVCLDEMNLAPVEHYFAEMLSIMETRKHPKKEGSDEVDKEVIKTGTIVDAQHFREFAGLTDKNGNTYTMLKTDREIYLKLYGIDTENDIDEETGKRTDLTTEGLTLPDNVIIIGTVNMDDTTHQFSRKVIDRAMTIEMNGGKLSNMFGGSKNLEYLPKEEQERWQKSFRQRYVNADEVLEEHSDEAAEIIEKVPAKLENINKALKGTPFEVSYRVLNELTIMVGVLLDTKKGDESIDDIINQALDRILLMKILPRIEGDSDMFNLSKEFKDEYQKKFDVKLEYNNRLEWLMDLAPEIKAEEQEGEDHRQTAREKIKEMIDRLKSQEFTRFWP